MPSSVTRHHARISASVADFSTVRFYCSVLKRALGISNYFLSYDLTVLLSLFLFYCLFLPLSLCLHQRLACPLLTNHAVWSNPHLWTQLKNKFPPTGVSEKPGDVVPERCLSLVRSCPELWLIHSQPPSAPLRNAFWAQGCGLVGRAFV